LRQTRRTITHPAEHGAKGYPLVVQLDRHVIIAGAELDYSAVGTML